MSLLAGWATDAAARALRVSDGLGTYMAVKGGRLELEGGVGWGGQEFGLGLGIGQRRSVSQGPRSGPFPPVKRGSEAAAEGRGALLSFSK